MGSTSPDGIRYPSDYNLPADVPNDMQKLATDTQTALSKRMHFVPTVADLVVSSGWAHGGGPVGNARYSRSGRLVVSSGQLQRTSNLTVTDNTPYDLGTIPAGYRTQVVSWLSTVWRADPTGDNKQYMHGILLVQPSGLVQLFASTDAVIHTGDWVSFNGHSWFTP